MNNSYTIFSASLELDIDDLLVAGREVSLIDLMLSGDRFLDTPCDIIDGVIHIASVPYPAA